MKSCTTLRIAVAAAGLMAGAWASDDSAMDADIHHLAQSWAHIKYQVSDQDQQADQMKALGDEAAEIVKRYPGRAEPLVWDGVITSTEAGLVGAFSAMHYAKDARDMFEAAGKIDPNVLNGAVQTSLGSLYYMVPGFPLGFGSKSKARDYLEKGVAIAPDGLDANYFYGDFLFQQHEFEDARKVLRHALDAPADPDRPVWDAGRRAEVRSLLEQIDQKLASNR